MVDSRTHSFVFTDSLNVVRTDHICALHKENMVNSRTHSFLFTDLLNVVRTDHICAQRAS